jgi:hypothetical protein
LLFPLDNATHEIIGDYAQEKVWKFNYMYIHALVAMFFAFSLLEYLVLSNVLRQSPIILIAGTK